MFRSEDRIRTTHVGSLVRPARHVDASTGTRLGAYGVVEDHGELAGEVADVVQSQVDHGVDILNDGEYGKSSWSAYVLDRISGFEIDPARPKPLVWLGRDLERFKGFFETSEMAMALGGAPAEVCVGPITYVDNAPLKRDLANLAAAAAAAKIEELGKEIFFTTVAPASTAYQGINEYYATEEEYIFAIADALAVEYRTVIEAGFILQVDDAVLANMYDYLTEQGEGVYERWAQLRVDALNHALQGLPQDRVRYHVCFGSWHVPHVADAPLEAILPFLLQVDAGAYAIEAANPRHEHEWTVWQDHELPEDKVLIPGIVSHHTITVEHPELVAQRIGRFADLLGKERVIGGTDCGFAQSKNIQRVHPEVMWAKLDALAEGAAIASSRLFR